MTTTTTTARPLSPFSQVLLAIPEADRDWVTLDALRMMNMVGGRPSDCARSSVRAYENGSLTYEKFKAERAR